MPGSEKLIESQRAEAALRESEEHYRAVAQAATDGSLRSAQTTSYLSSIATESSSASYSTKDTIGHPLTRASLQMDERKRWDETVRLTRIV